MSTGSVWSRRAAPLLALALGVAALGFGAASVVLDKLAYQPASPVAVHDLVGGVRLFG